MPPANAIDLLWQRLDGGDDEVSFERDGSDITAAWGEDAPVAMESDERAEIGQRAVFRIVRDVCEDAPELELEWFAIGFFR
jgi:hypothetical protein